MVAEHNPDADFSQFRTFSFAEPLATDRQGRRTTLSAQLMAATTRELQARGLQPVSNSPEKCNLIAKRGENKSGGNSGLVLSGHTDTVPYDLNGWDTDPFSLTKKEGY